MGQNATRAGTGLAVLLLAGCSATQAAEVPAGEAALERTISTQLQQDPAVEHQFLDGLRVTGEFRCGVKVLDVQRDGTHRLSVLCGDFVPGQGMARGGVARALVALDDDGTTVTSVRFPTDRVSGGGEGGFVPSQAELAGWDR